MDFALGFLVGNIYKEVITRNVSMVKIELNKRSSFLVAFVIVLVGVGFVYAYTLDGSGIPSIMGHSSGEVDVVIDGVTMTLQEAIDSGALGGSEGGCPEGYSWDYVGSEAKCITSDPWTASCVCSSTYMYADVSGKYEDGEYSVKINSANGYAGAACSTGWVDGLYASCYGVAPGAPNYDVAASVSLDSYNVLVSGDAHATKVFAPEMGCMCTADDDGELTSESYATIKPKVCENGMSKTTQGCGGCCDCLCVNNDWSCGVCGGV